MQAETVRPGERKNNNGSEKYLKNGRDFIDENAIDSTLESETGPDRKRIEDITEKSLSIEALSPAETACLLNTDDPEMLELMREAALKVKKKVYDNRIVTFAPLYLSNLCINDCLYCGFRRSNDKAVRRSLSLEEIKKETGVLAGKIGHKRLIAVCGEHPDTGCEYIREAIEAVYSVRAPANNRFGQIRRVNVNAAPMDVSELKSLKEAGIGTYQVFQETYRADTYARLHPENTIKGDYRWRLYCMHRAMEAGIDDVGIGALFGLSDWKFEVMALAAHSRELEEVFGVGPHTISFPRLEPSENTPFSQNTEFRVSDSDFLKLITVIRLAVPYTGLIVTAREPMRIRKAALYAGITQTDASTRIGIGAYSDGGDGQEGDRQQFYLGDTRSLDEVIREFSESGFITSFCTAGYRCSRTGKCIMDLLKSGKESTYCKLNAVLTFREWLDDFASPETKKAGEKVIAAEAAEIKEALPEVYSRLMKYYKRIEEGERDLYF